MTGFKTTKRALVSSVIALFLCFSMLLGTTFAWFTDSVTSSGNVIQSGTLDITMEWKDATASGAQQTYKDASLGAIFNYDKWEPGYVEAKNVKISNVGTLALKYQLSIVANGDASKLTDAIDVYYAEGEYTLADREMTDLEYIGTLTAVLAAISTETNGDLKASESDTVTIALKMNENAGNEYQDLSIGSSFSVRCLATQLTYEEDSFDDQYDSLATIDNEEELLEALAGEYDVIMIGSNFTLSDSVVIPADKTVTIDLCGYTISQVNTQTSAYSMIDNNGNLTITDSFGNGKISYADETPYTADPGWASNTIRNLGTLNITGGTVENITAEEVMSFGYPHAIDVYPGSVTNISGGTVKSLNYDSIRMFCNSTTDATTVNISGGTIINRVSFQNPNNNTNVTGYGVLNISGGNFVSTDDVNANVRLLQFATDASKMKATITGGTFDKGIGVSNYTGASVVDKWIAVSGGTFGNDPSAYLADGYKSVVAGNVYEVIPDATSYATASTAAELQAAIDNAANENYILLTGDIVGDITAKQIFDLEIVINGDGHNFAGVILVDGNSATEVTSSMTLKNINFVADTVSADACIQLGNGTNTTRYTCNVTVDNCTFDVPGVVGVKSYTGGDKNLKIVNCTATSRAHSLAQLKGVDGVLVQKCTVNSVRGLNLNNSLNIVIDTCTIDVQKYAVRFGESGNTFVENYEIKNSSIASDNVDGDAAIVLRAGAVNANLTITNTTITAVTQMSGHENANVVIN